ncbi:MAG: YbhB/YbcL family Raf kinase inhibitor-like protein, partial [Campylobacterota bacterium]
MKKIIKSSVVAGLLFGTALIADGFTLKSDDMFGQMSTSQVFNGFGCTGKNISPQLTWSHAPKGTKSFAVTMYDPDAPTGSGWWHWLVFNISQETQGLEVGVSGQDKMPKGAVESKTDYGTFAFG